MRTRPAWLGHGGALLSTAPLAEEPAKTMSRNDVPDEPSKGSRRRARPAARPTGGNGIAELARTQAEAAIRTLSSIMRSRKGTPASRIAAANALLARGFGRPAPGSGAPEAKGAADLSDEDLLRIIEEHGGATEAARGARDSDRPSPDGTRDDDDPA